MPEKKTETVKIHRKKVFGRRKRTPTTLLARTTVGRRPINIGNTYALLLLLFLLRFYRRRNVGRGWRCYNLLGSYATSLPDFFGVFPPHFSDTIRRAPHLRPCTLRSDRVARYVLYTHRGEGPGKRVYNRFFPFNTALAVQTVRCRYYYYSI